MPKSDYIKEADVEFAAQLLNFKNNIGPHTALLGLTPAQVSAQAADADRFNYEIQCVTICDQCAQQWTAWKNIVRDGGTEPVGGAPVAVSLPTPAPAAVAPGVEPRFRALVRFIKSHPNYNAGIGEVLGVEGQAKSGPDFETFKPKLVAAVSAAGVMVRWGWQGEREFLDTCEIHVERTPGAGFALLAIDTTPNYLDTQPMPATPAKWTYKAVFRKGDARVGQWSDVVSVNVG